MIFHVSSAKRCKIKALQLLAILIVSEGRRVGSNILAGLQEPKLAIEPTAENPPLRKQAQLSTQQLEEMVADPSIPAQTQVVQALLEAAMNGEQTEVTKGESSSLVEATTKFLPRLKKIIKKVPHAKPKPLALPPFNAYATAVNLRRASKGIVAISLSGLVMQLMQPAATLSRWLFLRTFGAVAFGAFLSVRSQILGLMGSEGILPVEAIAKKLARPEYKRKFPVMRLILGNASDSRLKALCTAGAVAAASVTLLDGVLVPLPGPASLIPSFALLAVHSLYRTIATAGGQWFGLQWDALLQEVSFLASLVALPPAFGFSKPARWLVHLLLSRLMVGSGVVKLASGDRAWQKLRAMDYHYLTQPLPARAARLAHLFQGRAVSTFSSVGMFFVELLSPILFFGGSAMRLVAFALQAGLQLMISATGNYGFFNALTLAMCVFLLDDSKLSWLPLPAVPPTPAASPLLTTAALLITLPIAVTQAVGLSSAVQGRLWLPAWMGRVHSWWNRRFSIGHPYGLFATMTTKREEVVIEGTDDWHEWRPYGHRYKPDADLGQGLKSVPPLHMPRLDWWLWFVPLGQREWLPSLCRRLLTPTTSPDVLKLFDPDRLPFPDPARPPKAVRVVAAEYTWARNRTDSSSPVWRRVSSPRVIYGPCSLDDSSSRADGTVAMRCTR